jgi:ubiquinone/menaquinone biosynthesis C-methylase UbiE
MGIWHGIRQRLTGWLNQRTETSRRLVAQSTVLGGPVLLRHRLMARAYFSVAASTWDESDIVEDHFDSFEAGLERVEEAHRALDMGTGAGGSAAMVARRFPEAEVIGIDLSRRMLRLARRRHPEPNLEFRRASVERLPFPDRSFDLVTMSNAVPKLAELARVAEDGARVLITNTFVQSPDENMWMPVWTKAGFRMLDSAEVATGYWQLWEREAR